MAARGRGDVPGPAPLGSRLRGNDGGGWRGNDGGWHGNHPHPNPLLISPWERGGTRSRGRGVPACAGMTGGWHGNDGLCSPSDPLLISPWEGEGDGSRERGWFKENAPVSPRGRFALPSPPVGRESELGFGFKSYGAIPPPK